MFLEQVAEFLTLASTFFTLLIGLGEGSDIDKGLAESEGHELAQQAYWIILAFFCFCFTAWTMVIIFLRLNSLMYDLNSGHEIEANQYLEENIRKVLHKSKIESAILWSTKTRELAKKANSQDPGERQRATEAKEALRQVVRLFQELNAFRDRVSWNDSKIGKNDKRGRGNITRWDRRRLDRYFRDIDRSTVYMYMSYAAKLDCEDAEGYPKLLAENPQEEYPFQRLDVLEGFLRGLHACRVERTQNFLRAWASTSNNCPDGCSKEKEMQTWLPFPAATEVDKNATEDPKEDPITPASRRWVPNGKGSTDAVKRTETNRSYVSFLNEVRRVSVCCVQFCLPELNLGVAVACRMKSMKRSAASMTKRHRPC